MPTNRAILMTPPGAGAIAVVRIVGPDVARFLDAHFSKPRRVGRCVHGELRDGDRVIDDPVIVLLPDNRGTDINLHGGPWVMQAVLDLAKREGFEIVAGDNALRDPAAVDSTHTIEAEMLAHLPLASTDEAVRMLLAQPALWEEFFKQQPTADTLREIAADRSLWWMLHPPCVAIIGAPNVGKSTLANQLFGQERSITADLPGTTRDWVGELANIDGLAVMLLDTPGIRETSDEIERDSIARASGQVREADLIVIVLDVTRSLNEQGDLIGRYPEALVVANKCDLAPMWNTTALGAIAISARSGQGVSELRRRISSHFISERDERPRWWTQRQRKLLEEFGSDSDAARRMLTA
jgi:small GTP-binding protein